MKRCFFLASLTLLNTSCISSSQSIPRVQTVEDRIAKSDMELAAMSLDGFKGSVIAACNGKIVLRKDYGHPVQIGKVIRYEIASITKFLTSIAILKLVENDNLSLDNTLSDYFVGAPEQHSETTVFQLLTHQSGLGQDYAAEGHANAEAAAKSVFSRPLKNQPGESFRYSNDNFSLLAIIIEKASGRSYRSYLNESISAPLGISPIGFWPDSAGPHEYLPQQLNPHSMSANTADWGFMGGHGARLSVEEILKIIVNVDNGNLLSPKSLVYLRGPHVLSSNGTGIGMGWYTRTDKDGHFLSYTSGSDQSGGNAIAYKVGQNGLLIIAATNSGPAEKDGPGWSRRARDILINNLSKKDESGDICE